MPKGAGEVVRHDPAPAPMVAAAAIGVLTIIETVFVVLFVWGVMAGWNGIEEQQVLTFWLANAFITLAIILSLYRRFFIDDVVIVKNRKPKWEDLL